MLSDVWMPGVGGPELYREVEQLAPALLSRLVFLTGDILAPETREFLERPGVVFVRKPFAIHEIRRAVGRVLEAR